MAEDKSKEDLECELGIAKAMAHVLSHEKYTEQMALAERVLEKIIALNNDPGDMVPRFDAALRCISIAEGQFRDWYKADFERFFPKKGEEK